MNIKRKIHIEMNKKFFTKHERSDFLKQHTGKYHVGEMSFAECKKVLWHLGQLKTVKKTPVRQSVWQKLNDNVRR